MKLYRATQNNETTWHAKLSDARAALPDAGTVEECEIGERPRVLVLKLLNREPLKMSAAVVWSRGDTVHVEVVP